MSEFKEYEDWEASLDQKYLKQLSPDAFELSPAAFYAGQQSQQAKISILQIKLNGADERADAVLNHKNKMIDELQARVDGALRHVVDHGGYDDLTHVINILKGNKDEN